MILAYIMIPILQAELNTFKDVIWNCHRIRYQKDQVLPDGVPNHIYTVPEVHDLVECGKFQSTFIRLLMSSAQFLRR